MKLKTLGFSSASAEAWSIFHDRPDLIHGAGWDFASAQDAAWIITDRAGLSKLTVAQRPRAVVIDRFADQELVALWETYPEIRYAIDHQWLAGKNFHSLCHLLCRQDTVPLQNLLGPKTTQQILTLSDYAEKNQIIDEARDFLSTSSAMPEMVEKTITGLWELIMNAAFHAPQEAGKPRNRLLSRDQNPGLRPEDAIAIRIGFNAHYLGIQVSDPWGKLGFPTLQTKMLQAGKETIDTLRVGAGVGIFWLYAWSSLLDYTVVADVGTHVTALFSLSKRFKDVENAGHSLLFSHFDRGVP